jgi:hypothetical protein
MKFKALLDAGEMHLEKHPGYAPVSGPRMMFPQGARWMHDRLNELEGSTPSFDTGINYSFYGYLKYSICTCGLLTSAWWLSGFGWLFIPLSILPFYFLEIHFLFLFPLLIDHAEQPVTTSIREMFRIGVIRCLSTVIPVSIFMMTGLIFKKDRLRNWYVGCLAILIWYNNEVRNRTPSPI